MTKQLSARAAVLEAHFDLQDHAWDVIILNGDPDLHAFQKDYLMELAELGVGEDICSDDLSHCFCEEYGEDPHHEYSS
jgi:hypothetical protein